MRTLPEVKNVNSHYKWHTLFSPCGRSANSQCWIQYQRWHHLQNIWTACWKCSVCLLFTFHHADTGGSCRLTDVFFSAAVMVIFKCILRSSIPQGRSFPHLAQSWWLCCCPFDLGRTISHLMYNFDFLVIKIAVWALISPPPIHPAEVQGYLWNMSIPWFVNIEEVSVLLFS